MHTSPAFLPDTNAHQFREICWGYGSARAVLVVEREDETQVIGDLWCWLCSRAIHQDCLDRDNPATLGCRHKVLDQTKSQSGDEAGTHVKHTQS